MGRRRMGVRVIDQPSGTRAHAVKKNEGRVIHGLNANGPNRPYYIIDASTGNRVYRGTDRTAALSTSAQSIEFRWRVSCAPESSCAQLHRLIDRSAALRSAYADPY